MSENAIQPSIERDAQLMETVLLSGDLEKLTPAQRVNYYLSVCNSLGLEPKTNPFGYIKLNGKLVLYAKKECAEQLRSTRHVSITQIEKQFADDLYIVTAHAQTADGRTDASTGAVTIGKLTGDAKANAIMKAETKAKRRVTLSICGLGFLDETEVETIPSARPVVVTDEGVIQGAVESREPQLEAQKSLNLGEEDERPDREMISPAGQWAVDYAAEQWKCKPSEAAQRLWKMQLGKMIDKEEFKQVVAEQLEMPPA